MARALYSVDDFNASILRLDAVYATATPTDVIEGLAWYAVAHGEITKAALATGLPEPVLAAAMAVLSIQTEWGKNLRSFWLHVAAFKRGEAAPLKTETLVRRSDRIAGEILRTGDVTLLGDGPKTGQFQLDLLELDSPDMSTIDSIMAQAGLGIIPSSGLNKGQYATVNDAVCHLADVYGIRPYQFQAIVWVTWRRHHGAAFKKALRAARRAAKLAA